LGEIGEPDLYDSVALSRDGQHAAFGVPDTTGQIDIWTVDLARGVRTRFTFDAADDSWPVWSPDGKKIAYMSRRGGQLDLYMKPVAGEGNDEVLLRDGFDKFPLDWSPDGQFLLYRFSRPATNNDLWLLPMSGERKPLAFLESSFSEGVGRFSPDGRWVAYHSNQSGRTEVYVASFPSAGAIQQVSVDGGTEPHWRQDGKELFFLAGDAVMSASVSPEEGRLRFGVPQSLFAAKPYRYDVLPGGSRFIFPMVQESPASLTAVVNWPGLLKK